MDIIKNLDYKKPIISTSIKNIDIKTSISTEISFIVKNIGEGNLCGEILCDEYFIKLNKTKFENNRVEINCIIDVSSFFSEDIIKTNIKILSNGGDISVPISICITKEYLETRSSFKIYNIQDFFKYYKENPAESRSLFFSKKFESFIKKINSSYPFIYNMVIKDINSERAIENFFLMLDLKEKTIVKARQREINLLIEPFNTGIIKGVIELEKIGSGYFEMEILDISKKNWLKCEKNIITNADFSNNKYFQLDFEIDTNKIISKIDQCVLVIDGNPNNLVKIKVKKTFYAKIILEKEVYNNGENGRILLENLCSKPINFKIETEDGNILILQKNIIVDKKSTVSFKIKLTPIQIAKVKLLKQPYFNSIIKITGTVENINFVKERNVTIGTTSLELK